jgi:hypothetical protein
VSVLFGPVVGFSGAKVLRNTGKPIPTDPEDPEDPKRQKYSSMAVPAGEGRVEGKHGSNRCIMRRCRTRNLDPGGNPQRKSPSTKHFILFRLTKVSPRIHVVWTLSLHDSNDSIQTRIHDFEFPALQMRNSDLRHNTSYGHKFRQPLLGGPSQDCVDE